MALRARGKGKNDDTTASTQQQQEDIADAAAATRRPRGVAAAAEASAQRLTRQEQAREERAREQLRETARAGLPSSGDFPSVPLSTIANIAVHSLLMVVLPLGLYYAAVQGHLDPAFAPAFGAVRRENRPLLGGVLAVLGVNAVIVSFLVRAFREPVLGQEAAPASSRKRD
jgi:hypothetical protein